jgi:hypothetical protein
MANVICRYVQRPREAAVGLIVLLLSGGLLVGFCEGVADYVLEEKSLRPTNNISLHETVTNHLRAALPPEGYKVEPPSPLVELGYRDHRVLSFA